MTKGEKTKKKLIEVSAELFSKYEVDNVTVDSIVEAAGVSKGTFYIYFESKDELITKLLYDYVIEVDADYEAHLKTLPSGITSRDMLLSLIDKITDVLINSIGCDKMKIVYKVQLAGVYNMDVVKGYNRRLYQIFASVLERGRKYGEFSKELPLEIMTKHLVMAIRGLTYEWCIRYPDFDLNEEAQKHFRILLNGIQEKR